MVAISNKLKETWEDFEILDNDIEFIYSYLLEKETPLPSLDILEAIITNRIQKEKEEIVKRTKGKGKVFIPKDSYEINDNLVFPEYEWKTGKVVEVRDGFNPGYDKFKVIQVKF